MAVGHIFSNGPARRPPSEPEWPRGPEQNNHAGRLPAMAGRPSLNGWQAPHVFLSFARVPQRLVHCGYIIYNILYTLYNILHILYNILYIFYTSFY